MKTIPAGLSTHLTDELTTLATCWKITRRDATELFFTDHDQDILFDGETYTAASGYSRTAVQTSDQLNPDNLDVEGLLDSAELSDADLRNGLYDRAAIEIFLVNWADPTAGRVILRRGWLGEVSQQGAGYKAEIRGLLQSYSQHYGQLFSADCRADLGDARCKVDLDTPEFTAEGTVDAVVTARRKFTATANEGSAFNQTTVLDVPTWQANTLYHPTFSVKPTSDNGLRYVTEVRGKSGNVEPVWPAEETETIDDHEQVWKPIRDEWYQGGLLTWLTGLNAGLTGEVKRYDADTSTFELFLPTPFALAVSDTFRVEAGCNKLRSTCKWKFDNLSHNRSEPFVPGLNAALDYPDARALEDLIG